MLGPVLILGPQGAGKTTLGRGLEQVSAGTHLGAGTLLRLHARRGGRWAEEIDQRLSRAEGVRTEISYGLLGEAVSGLPEHSFPILDGYPRHLSQVPLLEATLGAEPVCALLLNVPRPVAVERVAGRDVCEVCDAVYGRAAPAEVSGVCDYCGGALGRREDDSAGGLARRIGVWQSWSSPVIESYRSAGILVEVDATQPVQGVREQAWGAIRDLRN